MTLRLLVLGLDCVPPALVFDRLAERLPNLSALRAAGASGPLRSSRPPVTLPAWSVALSGRDPGELGLYGFRERDPRGYGSRLPSGRTLRLPRLWDHASGAGMRSVALFVPPSNPPPPLRGVSAACLLHEGQGPWTFPPERGEALAARLGPYRPDAEAHRAGRPEALLEELHALAEQHVAIAEALLREERPEVLTMVEIGPDRLHHALWPALDPDAPQHEAMRHHTEAAVGYYTRLDALLGRLLQHAGPETTVLLFSDHGAHALRGGVRLPNLLHRDGWLSLRGGAAPPRRAVPLGQAEVDWSRTLAWAEGGHWGRLWLNVAGREPQGCVPPREVERRREELAAWVESLTDAAGRSLGLRALRPERIYRVVRGRPPDLWVAPPAGLRPLGTLGGADLPSENDTGPDRCNHDPFGFFVAAGPGIAPGPRADLRLPDVFRTAMAALGLPAPPATAGSDRRVS